MIELENVSKVYPTPQGEVRALDGVTLSVEAGEFVAVRGPSGCGKSTLLALLGGLTSPTSGTVRVAGDEISAMDSGKLAHFRSQKLGFVFQMFHLLPYLTVEDNVLLAAGPEHREAARKHAAELLESFGLGPRRYHRPAELSAGERQRVAMARALLNRPALLLADEPTGNLDPASAESVLELLSQFHTSGGTILLVTHEEQAASYAKRTIALRAGQVEEPAATG